MTEAMPFLQKTILLSYDPRPFWSGAFVLSSAIFCGKIAKVVGQGTPQQKE